MSAATNILDALKEECDYHELPEESGRPQEDWPTLGSTDSLIEYKDALENQVVTLTLLVDAIAALFPIKPEDEDWDQVVKIEQVLELLAAAGIERPEGSDE